MCRRISAVEPVDGFEAAVERMRQAPAEVTACRCRSGITLHPLSLPAPPMKCRRCRSSAADLEGVVALAAGGEGVVTASCRQIDDVVELEALDPVERVVAVAGVLDGSAIAVEPGWMPVEGEVEDVGGPRFPAQGDVGHPGGGAEDHFDPAG